jgi:hypothetical protein
MLTLPGTEIQERITLLVTAIEATLNDYWERNQFQHNRPTHRADYVSDKWCRITTVEQHGGQSVYCFVALQDNFTKALGQVRAGDIHKAASWKAPAKHARGNVLRDDFRNCLTPHGIVYLRG